MWRRTHVTGVTGDDSEEPKLKSLNIAPLEYCCAGHIQTKYTFQARDLMRTIRAATTRLFTPYSVPCVYFEIHSSRLSWIISHIDFHATLGGGSILSGSTLLSTFLINLFVCSANVSVRICIAISLTIFNQESTTHRMWQYPCQMRAKSLINRQYPFRLHSPVQAIERTGIQIPSLVIHPTHDRVRRVHKNTDHKPAHSTTSQM